MPWFKVDDGLTFHPKVAEMGRTSEQRNEAIGAWVRMGAYCAAHLTDGVVPRLVALSLTSRSTLARLSRHGWLNTRDDGDYQLHDYLEYNPSAEEIKSDRKATADRQARWKEKKKSGNGVTNASSNGVANSAPSHPIPSQEDQKKLLPLLAAVFDFDSVYREYPLKKGKTPGLKICKRQIKTQADFDVLLRAVRKYAAERKGQDQQYTLHFSTFMGRWRDWLDSDSNGAPKASDAIREMTQRAASKLQLVDE
jgi:hypothetical protein